jgi:hypothetical protein
MVCTKKHKRLATSELHVLGAEIGGLAEPCRISAVVISSERCGPAEPQQWAHGLLQVSVVEIVML